MYIIYIYNIYIYIYIYIHRERERKRERQRERERDLRHMRVIDAGWVGSTDFRSSHPQGGVRREKKLLKGHLPRVIYHQVY